MTTTNLCAKKVTPETAYEVWQSYDGTWTYFVLKKYQSPEKEAQNPYAQWYCLVKSPTTPSGEFGEEHSLVFPRGLMRQLPLISSLDFLIGQRASIYKE